MPVQELPPRGVKGACTRLLLIGLAACAAPTRARPVDQDLELAVETLLARARGDEIDGRGGRVVLPREAEPAPVPELLEDEDIGLSESPALREPGSGDESVPAPLPPGTESYDLQRSLEQAFRTNRSMISRREALFLDVLSLLGTRHQFQPQVAALLAATFADSEEGLATFGASFAPSVSQRLTHGGSLSLAGRTSWNAVDGFSVLDAGPGSDPIRVDNPDEYDLSLSMNFTQPLLRGFGYDVSHEGLIQAERNLIYAVRDFELFREDFSIEVAQRFYGLIEQKTSLANQRENIEISNFQRRKAEAMYEIGRGTQIDLFRAERTELQDRNNLIQAVQAFELALARFKIFLGIDIETPIDIVDEKPPEILVNYDPTSAVEIAKQNRLDYLTRKQRLEDSTRGLRLSRDGLRSDLNLNAGYSLAGDRDTSLAETQANDGSWNVGLSWDIPLDRVDESYSHRAAQIAHQRAIRDFQEFDENLEIDIQNSFRELARVLESIRIQETLIESQEKNLKKATIDYENGLVDNREVGDAQRALTQAKNGKIREQVNYEIARLQLLKDLGILFVDSKGMWREAR